jgi:hypothetical protein
VDKDRIAFYGLSYGGKTAVRVPAILTQYCLSICSGDFNEWIRKNVSPDYPGTYMLTHEFEMPEFGVAREFSYAEMVSLIAPRPFMVERGHHNPVGTDEWGRTSMPKCGGCMRAGDTAARRSSISWHRDSWVARLSF